MGFFGNLGLGTLCITLSDIFPDSAVFHQFKRYLDGKGVEFEDLTSSQQDMQHWGLRFLEDTYPGIEAPPNELIRLLASEDVDKTLRTRAILYPEEGYDSCDQGKRRKKRSVRCPKGWQPLVERDHTVCVEYTVGLLANFCCEIYGCFEKWKGCYGISLPFHP